MGETTKKGIYEVDVDQNGALALTAKNVDFIKGILKIDSSYRDSWDEENPISSTHYIKNEFLGDGKFNMDKKIVTELVKRIDKENATHLSVSGQNKGDNKGIEITVDKICEMENLYDDLQSGSYEIVAKIASAVEGRNNFSFATKFCAYVSQIAFAGTEKADHYCIYDKVISDVLPYYAWIYIKEKHLTNFGNSDLESKIKNTQNYAEYHRIVSSILTAAYKQNGVTMLKSDFDKILWYYYKGDGSKRKAALEKLKAIET